MDMLTVAMAQLSKDWLYIYIWRSLALVWLAATFPIISLLSLYHVQFATLSLIGITTVRRPSPLAISNRNLMFIISWCESFKRCACSVQSMRMHASILWGNGSGTVTAY